MKSERLQNAIIDIDDDLIESADVKSNRTRQTRITKWAGLAAACFVLAIMTVIGTGVLNRSPGITPDTTPGIISGTPTNTGILEKHFPVGSDSEVAKEIPMDWDTMIDTQRFPTLSFGGHEFTTNLIAVHIEDEGELLGTTTMTGSYIKNGEATGEYRTTDVKVYAIRGIDTDVAVAVRFNETDKYSYAYSDDWYTPATLGDFVEKLNLNEYMKTGLCFYENGVGSDSETIVYEDIDTSTVWSMLLDDLTVENDPDFTPGQKVMSISVNVDVLGNHNKSISLTEDGYLYTNLLESGKFFFIGKDKVAKFVDEVTGNHQGYRYIYDLTGYDAVEE